MPPFAVCRLDPPIGSLLSIQTQQAGTRAWHLALTADDELLFITDGGANDVTAINVATLTPVKSVKVGRPP